MGSFKKILTSNAKAIPVRPRIIKILLQLTSSVEAPKSAAVAKYAAIIPKGIPKEYIPNAPALSSFEYISEIIEWEGGLPPASPIPTPILAIAICIKLFAIPVRAVKALQVANAIDNIFTLLYLSASHAIGIATVVYKTANARPIRRPNCVLVKSKSA